MPQPAPGGAIVDDATTARLATLRAARSHPRSPEFTDRGRLIHGPTEPGGSTPSSRTSDLTPAEVE
jgi:hypothetical protein